MALHINKALTRHLQPRPTLSFAIDFTNGELWVCINASLPGASKKSESWVGLGCCELTIAVECRRECKLASSKNDISKVCRKDRETALYSCINRNEMGSVCCSYAGRHTNCREYCQAIFRTDSSPTPSQIKAVENYCKSISPELIHCVDNYTQSYPMRNPIDSLYCCDRAEDSSCQTACKTILRTMTMENEIVDGLIEGCKKQPLPQDPLWQCFLESSRSPYPVTTVDTPPSPKLLCCSKANTTVCRDLCSKLYSTSWGSTQSWQEFESLCEYKPVEVSMLTCLADVQEPCQLGCKDLSYCTNFNNRPTGLFRSCNAQSDQGAMDDMKLWEKGSIKMPFMNIPVLDIRKCHPEMWKAVACSLQIKPCHSKSRGSIICKSDCVNILKHCGDQSKFSEGTSPETICDFLSPTDDAEYCIPLESYLSKSDCVNILKHCGDQSKFSEGTSPETICDFLSPTDDAEYCIPLESYLSPSSLGDIVEEVIHPCNPNPCPSNQLCEVNRKGCQTGQDCLPFICVQGCKMGEASEFLVHQEALIQVPLSKGEVGCYKVCTCGQSGRLENCVEMPCVDMQKSCIVGGQRKGVAVCYFVGLGMAVMHLELSRLRPGCVPKRKVCLTSVSDYICNQYKCVSKPTNCEKVEEDPVCDTDNVEHPNLCELYQRGKVLAYTGQCQDICKPEKPVCGHNGETYSSVCAAYSDRVAVDYLGHCHAVGVVSDSGSHTACAAITCPPLSASGCIPVIPPGNSYFYYANRRNPGACCPLCAGMLKVLWSKDQLNVFAKINYKQPVTVHNILRTLRLHISVPQCDIFGYLSIESEIVILIVPVDQQPTSLQVQKRPLRNNKFVGIA
ncbi:UNVERIFIED_CONTAM: hypothetical protein FKN15_051768 [Acipenser sinensis]